LSEPEVAAAYAERAAGAARQANRIKQVEQDAFHRIDRERDAWVVVTLLPDVPGDLPITAASSNEFQEATIGTEPAIVPLGINLHRARVAPSSSVDLDMMWVYWHPGLLAWWSRENQSWTDLLFAADPDDTFGGDDDPVFRAEERFLAEAGYTYSSPWLFRISAVTEG
jgi:hypothetical protein